MNNDEKNEKLDSSYMPYLNSDLYKNYCTNGIDENNNRDTSSQYNAKLNQLGNNYNQNSNYMQQSQNTNMNNNLDQMQGMNNYLNQMQNTNMNNNLNQSQNMNTSMNGKNVLIMIPGTISGTLNGMPIIVPQGMNINIDPGNLNNMQNGMDNSQYLMNNGMYIDPLMGMNQNINSVQPKNNNNQTSNIQPQNQSQSQQNSQQPNNNANDMGYNFGITPPNRYCNYSIGQSPNNPQINIEELDEEAF